MIRASVHTPDRTGYLIDFAVLPRVGEDVTLLTSDGETESFTVTDVRHIVSIDREGFSGGSHQIEVTLL